MTTASPSADPPTLTIPLDDVVEHFIHLFAAEGRILTHTKLQVLSCNAQALSLSGGDGPLFEERVEAWPGLAIVPALYRDYQEWEDSSIPSSAAAPPDLPPVRQSLLADVFRRYGALSVMELVALAMQGPWQEADWENHAELSLETLRRYGDRLNWLLPPEPPGVVDADGIVPDAPAQIRNGLHPGSARDA